MALQAVLALQGVSGSAEMSLHFRAFVVRQSFHDFSRLSWLS